MNSNYTLTEGNDALNRVLLMMRYDMGKTLNENILTEQVYTKTNDGNYELKDGPYKGVDASKIFPNLKQNEYPKKLDRFYSPIGGIPDDVFDFNRFRPSISPEPYIYTDFGYPKSHAYYPRWKKEWKQKNPNKIFGQHQQQTMDRNGRVRTITADEYGNEIIETKKLTFDEFMEEYRESLFSIPGMAIEAFLTATEFGAVPVVAAWGFLLWYDIKKGIDTGNWVWENLVIDILMVASAGLLGFGLKAIATSGKLAGKGLSEIIQILIKTKGGEKIVYWLKILSTKSGEIIKSIKPGLEWFSKSIVAQGAKWLSKSTLNVIKKMLQGVGYVISKVGVLIDKMSVTIEKQLNKIGVTGKLGKGLGAAGGITTLNLGILFTAEAIKKIRDKWIQMGIDANNENQISQHIIVTNPSIYGKDIIFKNPTDKKDLYIYKKSSKGIYSVYVNESKKWIEIEPDDEYVEQVEALLLSNLILNKLNLKFDDFEILDKNKKIYKINNKKYQAFGNDYKLKQTK
jgi:hypothetical protein